MTLKTRVFLASATVGMATLAGAAGLAALAFAAEVPTITASVQNSSNSTTTSALIGSLVHAQVIVASSTASTSPAGTVDFNLYSGNQSCTGSPSTQTAVALANGIATSAAATLPVGGLSYKVHYSGFNDMYAAGDSACVAVSATQYVPTLSIGLSNTSVLAGSSVYSSSTLVNESSNAGGSVAYKAYSNNVCTADMRDAGTRTVTNGSVPNSDSLLFNAAGTFYFRAVYSGDSSNSAATSTCTPLTVNATTTPPVVTGPGTISGTVFNDLNKDDTQNGSEPGLAGWTISLHKVSSTTPLWKKILKNNKLYDAPIVATATTDGNGNYSFGSLTDGTYFVEEMVKSGWKQTSSDTKVVLTASTTSADVDFANIDKTATSTKKGGEGKGKGADKDDDWHDNGKHNGWFKFEGNIPNLGNVFGWLKHK